LGNIVKYHNEVNLLRSGTLTEREINIFFSLLYKLQGVEGDTVIIDFKDLIKLEESNNRSSVRLVTAILNMNKKLIKFNQTVKTERGYMTFNMFRTLEIMEDTKQLRVSINEDFQFMLNDLLKNFTYYDLKELVGLKSTYSKNCYKLLRQYRANNFYKVKIEDFREILGVPNKETRYLNDFVLKPITKELKEVFDNFKIQKLTANGEKVTRGKKTATLYFTWKDKPKAIKKTLQENIKAKEDKEKIEADIRAKKRIKATEELIKSNKREMNELDIEKNKLCLKLIRNKMFELVENVTKFETLEEIEKFKSIYLK